MKNVYIVRVPKHSLHSDNVVTLIYSKKNVILAGIEATAPLVQWFWEVMDEFSNQERSLFLRFVWGRTRLPRTIADFRGRDFVLQVRNKCQDAVRRTLLLFCNLFYLFLGNG